MRLIESAHRFGVRLVAHHIQSRGTWVANIQYKPLFLLEQLERGCPVVFIDADATIQEPPFLFESMPDVDFAVYRRPSGAVMSGTIYVQPSYRALSLLRWWMRVNCENPLAVDDYNLGRILDHAVTTLGIRFQKLPVNYCYLPCYADHEDRTDGPVVIRHGHASVEKGKLCGS